MQVIRPGPDRCRPIQVPAVSCISVVPCVVGEYRFTGRDRTFHSVASYSVAWVLCFSVFCKEVVERLYKCSEIKSERMCWRSS